LIVKKIRAVLFPRLSSVYWHHCAACHATSSIRNNP